MLFETNIIPGTRSRLNTVDHTESYGRHILANMLEHKNLARNLKTVVDLGCGTGNDLGVVQNVCKQYGNAPELIGLDFTERNIEELRLRNITVIPQINLEHDKLPFADGTIDLFIANQVFEHCKEIFWINHEIFRCLRHGGYLFIGVPNILSLHNRILSLCGNHPTNNRTLSAHVRIFSRKDIYQFYSWIGKEFLETRKFAGSQFYPFPKKASRILSTLFPNMAYSIFFLIEKTGEYSAQFLEHPITEKLETNFFTGEDKRV